MSVIFDPLCTVAYIKLIVRECNILVDDSRALVTLVYNFYCLFVGS